VQLEVPLTPPPELPRSFAEVQLDWVWPRVTPRFLQDFPRPSVLLEPTLAPQATMSLLWKPGGPTENPTYSWFSARVLSSEGSAWRFLPTDGFGLLHTELTTAFADWYFEHRDAAWRNDDCDSFYRIERFVRWGVRAAYFDINSRFQSPIFPRQTDEQFVGAGPFLGLHNTRSFGNCQFQFFDDWEFVGLFGGMRNRDEALIPLDGGAVAYSATGQRGRFIMGFRFRAGWHYFWDYCNLRVRLSLGYQGEVYGHIGDEIDGVTVTFRDGEPTHFDTEKKSLTDMLSHGPFLQCEIRY